MDKIIVNGGNRLIGSVIISGAKNAALPLMVAALLAEGKTVLKNVPNLRDVDTLILLLQEMGAVCTKRGSELTIDTTGEIKAEAPYEHVKKMRASIYVLGPLLARYGHAKVSLPGGCAWGPRPVDLHIKGMEKLGAKINIDHGYIHAEGRLIGSDLFLDTISVGATGNILMASVLADGKTIIKNAATEPEITNLAEMLIAMGAKITGVGTRTLKIEGVKTLNAIEFEVIPDRIEAGTFMAAAMMTEGEIILKNCRADHLDSVINKMREAGGIIEIGEEHLFIKGPKKIKSVDMTTEVYPGFPTDMQAQWMAMMSIADGPCIITDTIYHDRFTHAAELVRLNALINIKNNSAYVIGKERLIAAPVMSTDLRASASLIIAGLVAEGSTEVARVYHIDRGYEKIEEKFKLLGADIKRVHEKMIYD
jgi:UDP-N-acetylglucosamine 1-carboxyvinyltransferase